jgi:hypothetical protein
MEHTLAQAVSSTEATLREHAERLSQESKDHVTAQHADLTSMLVDLQHTVTKLQENQLAHNAAQIQHWRQYAIRDQEVQNLQLQLMNARNHAHRVQAFAISRVHGIAIEDAMVLLSPDPSVLGNVPLQLGQCAQQPSQGVANYSVGLQSTPTSTHSTTVIPMHSPNLTVTPGQMPQQNLMLGNSGSGSSPSDSSPTTPGMVHNGLSSGGSVPNQQFFQQSPTPPAGAQPTVIPANLFSSAQLSSQRGAHPSPGSDNVNNYFTPQ